MTKFAFIDAHRAELLGSAGRTLEPADVDRPWRRTEGWAAGLVLAELSLARAIDQRSFVDTFGGDDHLVVEYLSYELLDVLPEDDRQRLLEPRFWNS